MNETRRDLERCRRLRLRGQASAVVIIQADPFDATNSVTICPFTTDPSRAGLFRLTVEPDDGNGLRLSCCLMVDKITTVPRTKLGRAIGILATSDIARMNRAMMVFFELG